LSGAIIHVSGGDDMKLSEAARPAEIVSELMGEEALVIWGARIDGSLDSTLEVSLILTGVESTELLKAKEEPKPLEEDEIEEILEDLGIKSI